MPGILIQGLSIPKEGFINLSVQSEGLTMLTATSTFNEETGSYVWQKCDHVMYETVELPPHGDLIDRNELYELVKQRGKNWAGEWCDFECHITGNDIKNAPVIVPASEEENNT